MFQTEVAWKIICNYMIHAVQFPNYVWYKTSDAGGIILPFWFGTLCFI